MKTLILLLAMLAPCLGATMALKLDLDALTDKSTRVVIGKAASGTARWDAARAGIWTHYPVTVSETLKGEAEASIEVAIRGGVVGTTGQHVSGAGKLEDGKEYLLFLWKDDAGRWQLQGMIQGAFELKTRDATLYAANSLTGLTIVDPATHKPTGESAGQEYRLDDARARIKARAKPEAGK